MNEVHIGERLRVLRKARGMTQEDVQERTGGKLYRQRVSRIEKKANPRIDLPTLKLFAELFEMTPGELCTYLLGAEEPTEEQTRGIYHVLLSMGELSPAGVREIAGHYEFRRQRERE